MKETLMDMRSREEKLNQLLTWKEGEISRDIDSILYQRNRIRLGAVLLGLARTLQTRAVHAYFVKQDPVACRQNCYLASKLILASVDQDGGPAFETAIHILYALLSDSSEAIRSMAYVETPSFIGEREKPTASQFYVYMLQLAMRHDDAALQRMIELGSHKGNINHRQEFAEGRDFFSLLLKRDQTGLEDLIGSKHARIKNSDAITEDFIAVSATLEAKLCWLRGIPVQVNHHLVPMELVHVRPLPNYDDVYEFLKPGWVPPPQGAFADLVRRIIGK